MKRFTKGLKERWAPEHETDLMISWGWTAADEVVTPAKTKGIKETVTANPTVVPPEEDGSQLNQGEDDDSNSW
jgi:hypothetical protein